MAPTIPALPLILKGPRHNAHKIVAPAHETPPRRSPPKSTTRNEEPSTPQRRIIHDTDTAVTPTINNLTSTPGHGIEETTVNGSPNTTTIGSVLAEDDDEPPPPYKPYIKAVFVDRTNRIRLIEPFTAYKSVTSLFESAVIAGILGRDSQGLSIQIPGQDTTGIIIDGLDGLAFEKVQRQTDKICQGLEELEHDQRRERSRIEVRGIPLPVRLKENAW